MDHFLATVHRLISAALQETSPQEKELAWRDDMPSSQNHRTSRRGVLRSTAATATTALMQGTQPIGNGFGRPLLIKRGDLGIGVIGCRYQGSVIAGLAKSHGRLLAMADVDASVRDLSAIDPSVEKQTGLSPESIYEGVGRHEDYRRLLDDHRIHVILIGAPDHWHAGMLIDALKAGKDVYVEKPITLTIDEGKQIRKVMKDHRWDRAGRKLAA